MLTSPTLPDTFGAALRFLRKRARLTQDELGREVGYSREQIARLENGSRLPDLAVIAALFVPALLMARERPLVEQFLALAGKTRQRPATHHHPHQKNPHPTHPGNSHRPHHTPAHAARTALAAAGSSRRSG